MPVSISGDGTLTGVSITTADLANSSVTVAKISATGTPSSTTFLRGDGAWQTTTPTTDQVLTATAGATAGAVGTYAFGKAGVSVAFGSTTAGSNITPTAAPWASSSGVNTWSFPVGTALSGTWRAMGTQTAVISGGCGNYQGATLWLRIS